MSGNVRMGFVPGEFAQSTLQPQTKWALNQCLSGVKTLKTGYSDARCSATRVCK